MMAQDSIDQATVDISDDQSSPELGRSGSFSRLNADAPEFVPRPNQQQRMVKIPHRRHRHQPPPPPPPMTAVVHVFHPPAFLAPAAMAPPAAYEYFGGAGVGGFVEEEAAVPQQQEPETASPAIEELSDEVVQKITKQVEYYFSDANLATTEHLMRFISKDPEGFVPISVIATFKKIKALVHNNSQLANALRTSAKLIVSDDGKKVRRQQPITEADVDELQARIVVAENLPDDHHYQNLMKIFSAVGSVKTIRTCYPQTPNGSTPPTNRSAKMDMLFGNRLHAFVEYETVEDAEKAVLELNDKRNWRSGLRVRLLNKCMTKNRLVRGRKGALEDDVYGEEEDVSVSNHPNEKQVEDLCQPSEPSHDLLGEDVPNEREGGARRGRGRGRGGRSKGRGSQYHHNNNNNRGGGHHHPVGTPPSSHQIHVEQAPVTKPPPGPRMPDGSRGFTFGRGKPLATATAS